MIHDLIAAMAASQLFNESTNEHKSNVADGIDAFIDLLNGKKISPLLMDRIGYLIGSIAGDPTVRPVTVNELETIRNFILSSMKG